MKTIIMDNKKQRKNLNQNIKDNINIEPQYRAKKNVFYLKGT